MIQDQQFLPTGKKKTSTSPVTKLEDGTKQSALKNHNLIEN